MRGYGISRVTYPFLLPIGLISSTAFSHSATPVRSGLCIQAASWALIAGVLTVRGAGYNINDRARSNDASMKMIAFLLLGSTVEDGETLRRWMALLPWFMFINLRKDRESRLKGGSNDSNRQDSGSSLLLAIIVISASFLAAPTKIRTESTVLSIFAVYFFANALSGISNTIHHLVDQDSPVLGNKDKGDIEPETFSKSHKSILIFIRNMALNITLACLALSFIIEGTVFSGASKVMLSYDSISWRERLFLAEAGSFLAGIVVETVKNACLLVMLYRSHSIVTGLVLLSGSILTTVLNRGSISGAWWLVVFALGAFQYASALGETSVWMKDCKVWNDRAKSFITVLALGCVIISLTSGILNRNDLEKALDIRQLQVGPPIELHGFTDILNKNIHPVQQLMTTAADDFKNVQGKQSKTLDDATTEYKRRYKLNPPPNFDKWFEFAANNKVVLIDEFDTIHQDMLPFWALKPQIIRNRVSEALGFDNGLLAVLIRGGRVAHAGIGGNEALEGQNTTSSGIEEQTEAIVKMIQSFVHHLPDMDLAFNLHDEPRVVLQHSQLSKLVDIATNQMMPVAHGQANPRNSYSLRPADMNDGTSVAEVRETRFNRFARQATWSHARLSCSPDSPAQDVLEDTPSDNITSWAFGPMGFVMNTTALTDICQSPSLSETHGFFQRPNVFNIAQDLIPIFSPSKFSSFSDILYPPSWYWAERTPYDSADDVPWEDKNSTIYWRGSTTGGFSRRGGWRRHHRQRAVRTFTANDNAQTLHPSSDLSEGGSLVSWEPSLISRQTLSSHIDISFSHIGQCDPADCAAQTEFFHVAPSAPQSEAWKHKLLLDMDGNAFSGRFASFVASGSAVAKIGVVKEALIGEWIKPWVHYVPLSMTGGEWTEIVRYFLTGTEIPSLDQKKHGLPDQETDEETRQRNMVNLGEGDEAAKRIARDGSQWAKQALRKVDLEAWMFRLLLEYGRLIDDARDQIGYSPRSRSR